MGPAPHIELQGEEELLHLVGIYTSRVERFRCPFEHHSTFSRTNWEVAKISKRHFTGHTVH